MQTTAFAGCQLPHLTLNGWSISRAGLPECGRSTEESKHISGLWSILLAYEPHRHRH